MSETTHGHGHRHVHGQHMHSGHRYDLFAAIFFGGRRHNVFSRLAALSGAQPGDRIADIGCGTGYFTRLAAEAVAPHGTATGVDPSSEALAHARRLNRNANCTFVKGTAERLDLADSSVDVVVTSLMLHHLPEAARPKALGEMFRILRPDGRLLVAEFRPPKTSLGRRLIAPLVSAAMADNPIDLLPDMIRDTGFEQVESGDVRPWIRYVRALKPGPA